MLLTDDARVVQRLTSQLYRYSGRAAQLELELAKLRLTAFEQAHGGAEALERQQTSPESAVRNRTAAVLDQSRLAIESKDHKKAYEFARLATDMIGTAERRAWQGVVRHCDSAVTLPLAMTEATLADASRHVARVGNAPLSANLLAGGDFKDLRTMMASGWRHFRHSKVDAASAVELVRSPGGRQGTCLLLRAAPPDSEIAPRLLETPPVWVTSPSVHVAAGQLLRIEGEIYIPHSITGSVDGLLIAETIGGEALAYRAGVTQGWRKFTLYRVATKNGPVSVTIALTGHGEAWLDDVSIRIVGG